MKRVLSLEGLLGLVILLAAALYAYNSSPGIAVRNRIYTPPPALQKLLKRFQRLQQQSEEIPPALPFVYQNENPRDFSIALADRPLSLRKS